MSYFKNNGTNYTQVLAEYAANLTYDKIPAEVIERAKLMTLHTLGVSLAAKMDELAQNAVKIGSELNNGVGGSATVWTTGEKLSPANAVFVNFRYPGLGGLLLDRSPFCKRCSGIDCGS